ncbi:tRNA (adenosine(37)-N6)-threonylcarbamoyltransferase complex transferase subunit TsaD [Candidatus Dojkabacteria bacterium]|uniref:N(6)-L-threonylcarbamoyladenine synthase n=1 Tax=Candidatus Dojkabacteria bacterium TaxID=2099670 RepID=A0A3M0YYE1_9BACT|nr:MAG: tRNA (adenosine(37)-N6)-threonylcarbamoyltransferase complex transferase subunit TsaD [Candidatus Dojkabacteria bacterium]
MSRHSRAGLTNKKNKIVLGIDTSCDDTSVAVVSGTKVLSCVTVSQSKKHKDFGGVVPSLAKLEHQKVINFVVSRAIKRSGISDSEIDEIAVTIGPGLAIALEVGIRKATEISRSLDKKLRSVNHMTGHLVSGLIEKDLASLKLPGLGVLVSGGHTELVFVDENFEIYKVGETLDDACGECLDKCGRIIGLGYPAGRAISEIADKVRNNYKVIYTKKNNLLYSHIKDNSDYNLPIPMSQTQSLDMSFSGLKTAFNQLFLKLKNTSDIDFYKLIVLLENTVYAQILSKLKMALDKYKPKSLLAGGGVIASNYLRKEIRKICATQNVDCYIPKKRYTTDNAAMIGLVPYVEDFLARKYNEQIKNVDRNPNLTYERIEKIKNFYLSD